MIQARVKFEGDAAMKLVIDGGYEAIKRVTLFFWQQVQLALNVPNTLSTRKLKGERGDKVYTISGNWEPSAPGDPPRKRTAHLQGGVVYDIDKETLTSRVGILKNVIYGLYLEFGVPGGKTIEPTKAQALFFNNGKTVFFRKKIRQGAIAARPWLLGTLRKILPQLRVLGEQ